MRQDKVIWFAIVLSTFIYALILFTVMPRTPEGTFEDAVNRQFTLILYGMAVVTFLMALVVPGRLRVPARTRMIVRMALFEACVIYGLMAAFLARDWRLFLPTWIVGLIGMLRAYPSADGEAATTTV